MSLKNHITTVAVDLFSHNGIKRVSMDDIARKANVSKRTLYDFFRDKESLLIAVLNQISEPFIELMQILENKRYTALETMLLFNEKMVDGPIWLCDDFLEDIKRYPEALHVLMDGKNRFLEKTLALLVRGAKEGVFMPDINYDIISMLVQRQMNKFEPAKKLTKYTHEEVHNTMLFIFLRGICTETGRNILEKYIVKKRYGKDLTLGEL